jgi:hypothetical protein
MMGLTTVMTSKLMPTARSVGKSRNQAFMPAMRRRRVLNASHARIADKIVVARIVATVKVGVKVGVIGNSHHATGATETEMATVTAGVIARVMIADRVRIARIAMTVRSRIVPNRIARSEALTIARNVDRLRLGSRTANKGGSKSGLVVIGLTRTGASKTEVTILTGHQIVAKIAEIGHSGLTAPSGLSAVTA